MNKDNAAQFLPLVQAMAEGKTIQTNARTLDNPKWVDEDEYLFGGDPKWYRVKPEPREFDLWVSPTGEHTCVYVYSGSVKIRVREIL